MGSSTTLASGITYEPFGPLKSLTYGNGLLHTRGYDQNYWANAITTADGAAQIQDMSIGYDNAGNVTGITDTLDTGRNQSFSYDDVNRLASATGAYGTVTYTYDDNGNRLTRAKGGMTHTSTYPGASNRLTSISDGTDTRSFTYTDAGNIATDDRATDPDVTYGYNNRNRLATVSISGGVTETYLTNAWGERVARDDGTDVTHFHYDLFSRLLAETDDAGTVAREYIWLGSLPLAQVESGGGILYIHADHLGTPQKMTDAGQILVWDRQQEPFGEDYAVTGTADSPLRFPGQRAETAAGLYDNLMRDYDPTLGRYIEADPIGLAGGLDLYGYAAQDPLYWVDPRGEWIQAIIAGAVAACRAVCAPVAKAVRAARAAQLARQARNQQPKAPSNAAKAETKGGDAGVCKPAEASSPAKEPLKLKAQDNTEISGFTKHGVNRAIGDAGKRAGTQPKSILDAVKNPTKIQEGVDSSGRPFKIYTGEEARVIVNPKTGKIISTNPLSGSGAQ